MPKLFRVGGRAGGRGRRRSALCSTEGCEVWWCKIGGDIPHWSHLFCEGQWPGEKNRKLEPHVSRPIRWFPLAIRMTCFLDYLGIWGNISCVNLDITTTGSNVRTLGRGSLGYCLVWNSNSFCIPLVCKWNPIFPRLEIHLQPSVPTCNPLLGCLLYSEP